MAPRKQRIRVVFDTNVLVAFYLGSDRNSAVNRVVRLWRDAQQLELVVSDEVIAEYVEVLRRLGVDERLIARLVERLYKRTTVTHVRLGRRIQASRDPDDDLMLSTAHSGRVSYLVTNDRDLLDLPLTERRKLRFEIVRPRELLDRVK